MRARWVWRYRRSIVYSQLPAPCARRRISTFVRLNGPNPASPSAEAPLERTRNIGIIAHIDAGKTTTTERMLYYSGYTRRIGDVDEGSTVTDFLPAERARGITIQSAAITFNWPPVSQQQESAAVAESSPKSSISHTINLIDTPGHADFTFEVLRSLRILDGAVCILDGVAGVEAQTEKVWTQADHYRIPRIAYVNKLDRDGAAFGKTVKEIGTRLRGWPAVCQIPWFEKDGTFVGLGDVINLRGLRWEPGSDGKAISASSLENLEKSHPNLAAEMKRARAALVELLSEVDEAMVESFLEHQEDHLAIPATQVVASLRRCVLKSPQTIVPLFAGASFRNIGVQPLLDAVVDLLPSPDERPDPEISMGGENATLTTLLSGRMLPADAGSGPVAKGKQRQPKSKADAVFDYRKLEACALAFKVVADARRGVLVYIRVYSGTLNRHAVLFNTNLNVAERATRLLKMYASDAVEVSSVAAGQIAVISGLKHARTGDTLIVYSSGNWKTGPPPPINTLQLRPIAVPPPVFFTSVEPHSLSEEKQLSDSLELLLREDPSLHVSLDPESGQTHLAGMGELHLEIARDRLINDFKAKASTGSIEIGYREAILSQSDYCTGIYDREIAGKKARASCAAMVQPGEDPSSEPELELDNAQMFIFSDNNSVTIRHPTLDFAGKPVGPEHQSLPQNLPLPSVISALTSGASVALTRGPQHSYAMHSCHVTIEFDPASHLFPDTSPAALSGAARMAVQAALRNAAANGGTVLMEPVMNVNITVNESDLGSVIHDISSARGGQVVSLDDNDGPSSGTDSGWSGSQYEEESSVINADRIYAPPDSYGSGTNESPSKLVQGDRQRQIIARVPLKEMVGYLKHLRSLTRGRGTFVMSVDRFERMSAQRQKAALNDLERT